METPLGDFPPSYEEITGRYCAADEQMHPDAVPEDVEEFLKSCDFDFGHLTDAFVTSRAGLFNMERLELIATWPAALRRDHFERHFSSVLDDVEIEVLNMRFSGLKQARRSINEYYYRQRDRNNKLCAHNQFIEQSVHHRVRSSANDVPVLSKAWCTTGTERLNVRIGCDVCWSLVGTRRTGVPSTNLPDFKVAMNTP